MTYKMFDVVTVPFPFTDSKNSKRRPALVLSSEKTFNSTIGHSVMAMITSAKNKPWPLDVEIKNLGKAGLPAESVIRMKLFTLDHRFIHNRQHFLWLCLGGWEKSRSHASNRNNRFSDFHRLPSFYNKYLCKTIKIFFHGGRGEGNDCRTAFSETVGSP